MLHIFRESVGRYIAIAILGLIAVTFIFFGIDFSITQTNFAAKVNGEEIPIRDFDRELQATQNQYQQLYRIELTDDLRRQLRRSVLDQMVMREALRQQSDKAGYRVSNERVAESIRETPAFQEDGKFSLNVYRALLTNQGLTPATYEAMEREQLEMLELQSGISASTFLTPAEFRRYIELNNERREMAYARFSVADFLDRVEITDDAVAEHYEENRSQYMTEESVDLEYVELDQASVAATIDVSEDDLREYYESQGDRFQTPEERRVRHILISVDDDDDAAAEAKAASVRERLDAGEDFAALASELSDDAGTRRQGGELGWIGRGTLEGPFEDTLFSMQVGDIAGPIKTDSGYHILQLEDVRGGQTQSFESVRDELLPELRDERASGLFYDRANELADAAFKAYDELQSAADETGLELKTIDGFTRAGDPDVFPNGAPVVAAAFDDEAIVSGRNSDLLELSDDEVAVVRVAAHHPPEQKPLESVADEIRDELSHNEARARARAAADDLMAAVTDDPEQASALAESAGAAWVAPHWVERTGDTDDPPDLISALFGQPRLRDGTPVTQRVPLSSGDESVLIFSAVEAGRPEDVPTAQREQDREQLADQIAQAEMEGYAGDVRDRATVRVPDEVLNPQG